MASTQAMICSRPRSVSRPRSECGGPVRGSSYQPSGMALHHRRIVKANGLLDEREALFGLFHLRRMFSA